MYINLLQIAIDANKAFEEYIGNKFITVRAQPRNIAVSY